METSKDHAEHRARRFADGWYAIHFCHECQQEAVNAHAKVKELIGLMLQFITPDDSGFTKPTIFEWRRILEKARGIEAVLRGEIK